MTRLFGKIQSRDVDDVGEATRTERTMTEDTAVTAQPRPAASRSAVFAPLDQLGRAEAVVKRLSDAITVGLLVDSEQLPSESELAGQLGVSTVTVREALTVLRGNGLLETKRGRGGGSFVRAPAPGNDTFANRLHSMTLTEIRDYGDHYRAIAGTSARLAAERASDEEIEQLRALAGDNGDGERARLIRAERTFHLEVAAVAQSPRLTREEMTLQSEVGAMLWLPGKKKTRERHTHGHIAEAIAAGDGDAARHHTEEHVMAAVERLAEAHLRAG
jgi:DNA-binding FadR family transcriptional regulator